MLGYAIRMSPTPALNLCPSPAKPTQHSCGGGESGALGHGDTDDRTSPEAVFLAHLGVVNVSEQVCCTVHTYHTILRLTIPQP